MVTFKEILDRVTFEAVWDNLINYYPDMSQIEEKYFIVCESHSFTKPRKQCGGNDYSYRFN